MNIITQGAKKKQAVVKSGRRFVLSLDMLYVIIIRQLLSERQMFMITVGNAELKDAERLLEIYDYDWSCETSIYLDKNARRCGIGKTLYAALEKELKKMGILNMYACIGYPDNEDEYLTKNSAEFHSHIGFVQVGEFHKCGYKFGRWYNMIWMEKIIGEQKKDQAPVIGFKGAL